MKNKLGKNLSHFPDRAGRAQFIAKTFKQHIDESDSVLDVGSSDNDLKKICGSKVYGIDISGSPDKIVNLEKERLSNFYSTPFDTIVCTEVLEHIDNLHDVVDDMAHISEKYIIISLPNCPDIWKLLRIIFTGRTGKFYGLPIKKPLDRHKWFFSWKDIDIFFSNYAKEYGFQVEQRFLHYNYGDSLKGKILRLILTIFPCRMFAQSYWIVLKKLRDKNNI